MEGERAGRVMGEIMFLRSIRREKSNLEAFLYSLKNSSYFLCKMIKDKIQEGKPQPASSSARAPADDKTFHGWKWLRCQPKSSSSKLPHRRSLEADK